MKSVKIIHVQITVLVMNLSILAGPYIEFKILFSDWSSEDNVNNHSWDSLKYFLIIIFCKYLKGKHIYNLFINIY